MKKKKIVCCIVAVVMVIFILGGVLIGKHISTRESAPEVTLKEIGLTMIFPESWSGKFSVVKNEQTYIIYDTLTREAFSDGKGMLDGGVLFYIVCYDEAMTPEQFVANGLDYTGYRYLFTTEEKTYVLRYASDVQWDIEDKEQEKRYREMSSEIEDIRFVINDEYSFSDTTFYYGDSEYDITEHGGVNGIRSCVPAGKNIVLEGHVGPNNGIYCIFNTETKSFEPDIAGSHLIWHDDDITTAIYTFWNDICAYDGSIIATCDLSEEEYIYALEFIENNSKVKVTIQNADGNADLRTEIINLVN